jgi:hypothetical protein
MSQVRFFLCHYLSMNYILQSRIYLPGCWSKIKHQSSITSLMRMVYKLSVIIQIYLPQHNFTVSGCSVEREADRSKGNVYFHLAGEFASLTLTD